MLRELLLRDLTLHRRVLAAAAVYPFLLAAYLGFGPGANVEGVLVLFLIFGLVLLALLPLSLQAREGMLGTLGDLLALPASRREIVRLRFLEGLIALGLCFLLLAQASLLLKGTWPAALFEVLRSPAPLWILFLFLAYPMPFYLRWKGRGVALAYAILIGGAFGFMRLEWQAYRSGHSLAPLVWLGRLHDAWGLVSARLMEYGGPLLLLALFYRLSVWALERLEA